ncbi:MAG: GGDEF domain-containing protein, partial [Armatimonadetes bacterium]|nr:GGDEF domain-containing protein [Armatimonadota bacterium]
LFFSLLRRELKVSEDLRDTLHHSLRRVAAVYDVAHAANTGADLAGVLSVILDHAARATDAANGSVFLLLEDGQLKPTASLSTPPGNAQTPSELALAPAREALDARAPITRMLDARQAGRDKDASASIVYVPLLAPAGPIGVLSLVSRSGRKFVRRQLDFLTSLCSEAALAIENAQLRSELRKLAITDHLTGLPNRREVESRLALELKRGARYGRPVSLLMIDVDNLKEVNDEFGHAAGDDVLCVLARMMKENIRSSETAGRLGGDEFAIVLPETDARQAAALADRLIERVSAAVGAWPSLPDSDAIVATVGMSIGVADSRNGALPPKELMARADAALYEAKRLGKNRSWVSLDSPSATALAIADSNPIS